MNSTIVANPAVDYWEGYNEPAVATIDQLAWVAAFDVKRVELLATQGAKASIGNFGVGNPDITNLPLMEAYNPAIDAALAHGGILGLHEYSSPTMMGCFDDASGEGWTTGRCVHRQPFGAGHNRRQSCPPWRGCTAVLQHCCVP